MIRPPHDIQPGERFAWYDQYDARWSISSTSQDAEGSEQARLDFYKTEGYLRLLSPEEILELPHKAKVINTATNTTMRVDADVLVVEDSPVCRITENGPATMMSLALLELPDDDLDGTAEVTIYVHEDPDEGFYDHTDELREKIGWPRNDDRWDLQRIAYEIPIDLEVNRGTGAVRIIGVDGVRLETALPWHGG